MIDGWRSEAACCLCGRVGVADAAVAGASRAETWHNLLT